MSQDATTVHAVSCYHCTVKNKAFSCIKKNDYHDTAWSITSIIRRLSVYCSWLLRCVCQYTVCHHYKPLQSASDAMFELIISYIYNVFKLLIQHFRKRVFLSVAIKHHKWHHDKVEMLPHGWTGSYDCQYLHVAGLKSSQTLGTCFVERGEDRGAACFSSSFLFLFLWKKYLTLTLQYQHKLLFLVTPAWRIRKEKTKTLFYVYFKKMLQSR